MMVADGSWLSGFNILPLLTSCEAVLTVLPLNSLRLIGLLQDSSIVSYSFRIYGSTISPDHFCLDNNNNNNNSLYLYSAFSKRVMLKSADQRQGLQSSVGVGKFK